MTVMSAPIRDSDVDAVAREAGLNAEQTRTFRNSAASWAMEGMMPTREELRIGAEVAAGRLSFDDARRRLGL